MKLLSNQQRLHQVNTEQLFENYRAALGHAASYTYGMRWKRVRHTEYLFKDRDRRGNGKSLGVRSAESEALLATFLAGRTVAQERQAQITEKIKEQARLNKALRLNRVPSVVAREPLKKPRDLDQARAVAKLVQSQMPNLPFETTLTSLHGDVRKMLPKLIS